MKFSPGKHRKVKQASKCIELYEEQWNPCNSTNSTGRQQQKSTKNTRHQDVCSNQNYP